MSRYRLLPFPFVLALSACVPELPEEKEARVEGESAGDCTDAADNDRDGAFDCDDDGCAASPDCTAAPAAPEGLTIAIEPSAPTDADDLSCVIVTAAVDPNGDAVTYTRAWTVDGEDAGVDLETIPAGLTSGGETWTCTVTASDGTLTGTPASASVTIQRENAAPSAPGVAITPAAPTDDDVLTCTVVTESVDPDGDAVTYAYAWTVDGTDAGVTVASVGAERTSVGETWTCSVTARDGSATSEAGTASVSIAAAPTCGDGSVTLTASGVDFVTVCAQTFEMGCTEGQTGCESDEFPVTPVTLTNDYYVSQTEISQGQYQALMGTNPSSFASCGTECPVEQVNWNMAAAYANAVSAAAGLPPCYSCSGSGSGVSCSTPADPYACAGYRLLTEAEWEAAARCGEDTLYAGSNTLGDVAWYGTNAGGTPHAVATKAPNRCGLYDMTGNVSEWVHDWYSTFYTSTGVTDPSGPSSATYKSFRGADWYASGIVHISNRDVGWISETRTYLGLRLARTAR